MTGRWWRRSAAVLATVTLVHPAPSAAADDQAMLAELARQELRVATIAFRLLTAAPPLCTDIAPTAGLTFHDAGQYAISLRATAAARFGFAGRPAVLAVVPGGPADRAGIRTGDAVMRIAGIAVPADAAAGPDRRGPSYDAVAAVRSRLGEAMAQGAVTLDLAGADGSRAVRLDPVPACDSPVELQPGERVAAWSDGRSVAITTALAGATADDDELAALIGHEIAHNILRHRQRLEGQGIGRGLFSRIGSKARKVNETEREADTFGLYLAARAGYDPAAAASFWQRAGSGLGGGILADGTHPRWRERAAALRAVADEIVARQEAGEVLVPSAAAAGGE